MDNWETAKFQAPNVCLVIFQNKFGNPTGSGAVSIADILYVRDFIFGTATPTSEQKTAADVNGDGMVNIEDILIIKNIIFKS